MSFLNEFSNRIEVGRGIVVIEKRIVRQASLAHQVSSVVVRKRFVLLTLDFVERGAHGLVLVLKGMYR